MRFLTIISVMFLYMGLQAQGIEIKPQNKSSEAIINNIDLSTILTAAQDKLLHRVHSPLNENQMTQLEQIMNDNSIIITVSSMKSVYGESRSCTAIDDSHINMTYEAFYNQDGDQKSNEEIEIALVKALFKIADSRFPYLSYTEDIVENIYSRKSSLDAVKNVVITD